MSAELITWQPWQTLAVYRPQTHFCLFGGVGSGKTFTGSHYAIKCIEDFPGSKGLIGANTYDQLSQASLHEFMYWLDHYKYSYWVDQKPPGQKVFKSYKNIITVINKALGTYNYVFTRVMSKPNPLRGIEFTWYWLDEIKDTPQITHDVVLGRLRESSKMRGLVTGTTNGQDWSYKRFCLNPNKQLYGFTHVRTSDAVKAGILTEDFYQGMLQSYTPLMAAQELNAEHVNFGLGRAYYTASDHNAQRTSPWGSAEPDWSRPLIVGCDFNYSPAPAMWIIGQLGPDGSPWEDCIHWYFEIGEPEKSTVQMTHLLMANTQDAFLQIYGDASGTHGSTSNAGDVDYNQIAFELSEAGRGHTIDVERANPLVRDRVENMCRMLWAADGRRRMTYNPDRCPFFHEDLKHVGWKVSTMAKRARLDNKGNYQLTHSSDGAGYATWKVFPPNLRAMEIMSVPRNIGGEDGQG